MDSFVFVPLKLPDWCCEGSSPQKATSCLALSKSEISANSEMSTAAEKSEIPGMDLRSSAISEIKASLNKEPCKCQ